MTDFRQVQRLPPYSGGTVRDSHTILYSPGKATPFPGTQTLIHLQD